MVIQSSFPFRHVHGVIAVAILGLLIGSGLAADAHAENPGTVGNGNFVIGPDYKIDPDLTDQGIRRGSRLSFPLPLAASKIFRGDDKTLEPKKAVRKERKIFVYVPAAYQDCTKAPILVTLDGPVN